MRPAATRGYQAKVGDRVTVTLTGVLVGYNPDLGHWVLRGNAPGQEHIEWEWPLHWATEFVLAVPQETR